tara:strand:- start:445 stop:618 length:174 start_codon:yes stop_codon:yes gene_type:complete
MKCLLLVLLLIALYLLSRYSSSPKSNIKVFLYLPTNESLKKENAPESACARNKKLEI